MTNEEIALNIAAFTMKEFVDEEILKELTEEAITTTNAVSFISPLTESMIKEMETTLNSIKPAPIKAEVNARTFDFLKEELPNNTYEFCGLPVYINDSLTTGEVRLIYDMIQVLKYVKQTSDWEFLRDFIDTTDWRKTWVNVS